jgi:hypothetical protein
MLCYMRTTITLDDDVAALLKRLQKATKQSLKEVVNVALREGLAYLEKLAKPHPAYAVRPLSVGSCLLGSIDDIAETLAIGEGEAFR